MDSTRLWVVLGRVKVPGVSSSFLPLVGSHIPKGEEVTLAGLDIGYASGDMTREKAQVANGLMLAEHDAMSVPDMGLRAGLFVKGQLLVAGKAVELPVWQPMQPAAPHIKAAVGIHSSKSDHPLVAADETISGVEVMNAVADLPASSAAVWCPLGRSVGPVRLERVGLGYGKGYVLLLLDAELNAGGLRLGTRGLGLEFPVKSGGPVVPHLDGLSIGYAKSPIRLEGAFVRQEIPGYSLAVGGMAAIETPAFNVTALGAYAQPAVGGDPSLFVFGRLALASKSVGPPMFRITQLAAGFGYHSDVRTPTVKEVSDFPFVELLGSESTKPPLEMLGKLVLGESGRQPWVRPSKNGVWLAAGLHAVCFEMVDIAAVGIVRFGDDFSVGLYGEASAQFPKAVTKPFARVVVDLEAEYRSKDDVLEIAASMGTRSFLVDEECKLTGDARLILWFGKSAHPGDFVCTVGGYHPRFPRQAHPHYPDARRIGFSWPVSDRISVTGEAYAALTPGAFMAGGRFHAHGEWGPFSGDFEAHADAMLEWDPFFFDVDFGAMARGTANLWMWHPSIEVKVSGWLWGPPVGGKAQLDWGPIHVPVSFGHPYPKEKQQESLPPADFRTRMLPADGSKVVQILPMAGLLPGQQPSDNTDAVWAIAAQGFTLAARTLVPATAVKANGKDITWDSPRSSLSIRPSKITDLTSSLDITVKDHSGQSVPINTEAADSWSVGKAISDRVPAALWGSDSPENIYSHDAAPLVAGFATGLLLSAPAGKASARSHLPASAWTERPLTKSFPVRALGADSTPQPDPQSRTRIAKIADAVPRDSRTAVITEIRKNPVFANLPDSTLTELAKHTDDFDDAPLFLTTAS
ncbi:DUF6603 domain-containing protein [Streptomyces syringium]|uniref:DUF6603 domain-containing protein n=1 Tax=Streptomyces syringium TaxID=76729 RepID=UPI0034565148